MRERREVYPDNRQYNCAHKISIVGISVGVSPTDVVRLDLRLPGSEERLDAGGVIDVNSGRPAIVAEQLGQIGMAVVVQP